MLGFQWLAGKVENWETHLDGGFYKMRLPAGWGEEGEYRLDGAQFHFLV